MTCWPRRPKLPCFQVIWALLVVDEPDRADRRSLRPSAPLAPNIQRHRSKSRPAGREVRPLGGQRLAATAERTAPRLGHVTSSRCRCRERSQSSVSWSHPFRWSRVSTCPWPLRTSCTVPHRCPHLWPPRQDCPARSTRSATVRSVKRAPCKAGFEHPSSRRSRYRADMRSYGVTEGTRAEILTELDQYGLDASRATGSSPKVDRLAQAWRDIRDGACEAWVSDRVVYRVVESEQQSA